MDELAGELERLENAVKQFDEASRTWERPINSSHSTVSIHAGGIALAICAICCGVMMAFSIVGFVLYIDQSRKLDRMQDYWNVTLQYLPGLKDKLKDDPQLRKEK